MKTQKITKILAVTTNFPTSKFPERGVFVRNILLEMTRQNAEVDVIAPTSWTTGLKNLGNSSKDIEFGSLNVNQPTIVTIPLRFIKRLRKAFNKFNDNALKRIVKKTVNKTVGYDLCYCHFYRSGKAVIDLMDESSVPVILNFGESSAWVYDELYGKTNWVSDLKRFAAIIAVSKKNRDFLIKRDPTLASKIHYIPNGVDTRRFRPLDRNECRDRLGLPLDEKIAIFVGHFIERKGPFQVLKAIRKIGVKGIFLGEGVLQETGDDVLFSGSVINDDLHYWLNAADVFVLPSAAEGMSNAILEAMACGLPLVVSDLDFNREFLTAECAEFVDRLDPDDIARAIMSTFETGKAKMMKSACLSLVQQYKIENRINAIFNVLSGVIEKDMLKKNLLLVNDV